MNFAYNNCFLRLTKIIKICSLVEVFIRLTFCIIFQFVGRLAIFESSELLEVFLSNICLFNLLEVRDFLVVSLRFASFRISLSNRWCAFILRWNFSKLASGGVLFKQFKATADRIASEVQGFSFRQFWISQVDIWLYSEVRNVGMVQMTIAFKPTMCIVIIWWRW